MSTVVCQGLQSCLESQLMETRTLRLKLAPPKPQFSEPPIDFLGGGWSFLQTPPNDPNSNPTPKQDFAKEITPYVPPMAKKSLCMLSQRGLELCTENLGSESGTDTSESAMLSLSSSSSSLLDSSERIPRNEERKSMKRMATKKGQNFPPPLSSSNSIQVRSHREGGRLIIDAIESPKTRTYLQAERSNGRLRLSYMTECDNSTDLDSEVPEREESGREDYENDRIENEANVEENEENEEDEEEEEDGAFGREDMEGNRCEVGGEMGMDKFQRPSRCNEGGRGSDRLRSWEPFLVATS